MANKNTKKSTGTKKTKNLLEETGDLATQGVLGIADTLEAGKTINELILRRTFLLAEISSKQLELERIDRKLEQALKKNPINELFSRITDELKKFESKEVNDLINGLRPITSLIDITKIITNQTAKNLTGKNNKQAPPVKSKKKTKK
ncbi:MAG: hypothetical protein H7A24_00305 [Leptospiraceae bacterium]|nr:hypothetical protein [Leptospiraceae bacterium]MCP5510293.1 hypothetical protein [Leptospiraceae bacterium]